MHEAPDARSRDRCQRLDDEERDGRDKQNRERKHEDVESRRSSYCEELGVPRQQVVERLGERKRGKDEQVGAGDKKLAYARPGAARAVPRRLLAVGRR